MTAATRVPATPRAKALVLAVVLVAYFLLVLNNSVIFTGLPQVQRDLGLSATGLSWAQNAYTLVFGGLLLFAARAGDLLDRGRLLVLGLAIFAVASLLVGLSPTGWWMISARALQGVGAAIVAPLSLSLITTTFEPGPARTRAVAAYGLTAGVGASIGVVAGGAFATLWTWRVGFFVSVPIALVLIAIALKVLPRQASRPGSFDLFGAITSIVGMGALVYGITSGGSAGWSSPVTIAFIAGGTVVLVLFVLDERRAAQPILPLRLFASRQRAGAAIARLTFAGAIIAFFFYTSQYFQGAYHWSALLAGLAFLPMTVVQFALGLLVPRLTPRLGSAALVLVGFILVILGMLWLTHISPSETYLTSMAGPLVLIGAGQGLGFGPLTAVGVAGARSDDSGAASGLVNTAHQLGSTLGVAILTSVAAGATTIVTRTVDVYAGATVMLVVGLLAILFLALPGERAQQSRR